MRTEQKEKQKKKKREDGEEGETYGDLSVRAALGNWGFELSCTISRCLLQPAWEESGVGGTGACRVSSYDVSERPANPVPAFDWRHHLPRGDVHSKEKRGTEDRGTGLSGDKGGCWKAQDDEDK